MQKLASNLDARAEDAVLSTARDDLRALHMELTSVHAQESTSSNSRHECADGDTSAAAACVTQLIERERMHDERRVAEVQNATARANLQRAGFPRRVDRNVDDTLTSDLSLGGPGVS
jgi:hypothetical protein